MYVCMYIKQHILQSFNFSQFSAIPTPIIIYLFTYETVSWSDIHMHIPRGGKAIIIQLRKSYGEGTVLFSRNTAKDAGEAVFVLDKSHLKAVNRVLTCVGFQASTWGCIYKPALTELNNSFWGGGGGGWAKIKWRHNLQIKLKVS